MLKQLSVVSRSFTQSAGERSGFVPSNTVLTLKPIILTLLLLLSGISAHATTLSVALDGSQAYSVIQMAIDASANGDTVLVYPGRYLENLLFNGKNITLASLELSTGDRNFMYSTIIDANQNGSGIVVNDHETNVTIRGFSIVNGTGVYNQYYDWTSGGGIAIGTMSGQRSVRIINCQLTGNNATNGAGVVLGYCQAYLSGVSIHHNSGETGGGIYFAGSLNQYQCTFDPDNRCNIYSNLATVGSDLYYSAVSSVHVIVDTFTVANPWNFYATAIPSDPGVTNPYTFDILHTVHQEINHDLYVATWGNDANSGLSAAEPLKSVFTAMYRIASDSSNPKSVYMANGHYAPSTGQRFPLPVKSYTRLVGESIDGTIIDAESESFNITVSPNARGWSVEKMTLNNGTEGIATLLSGDYTIQDIVINGVNDDNDARGIAGSKNNGLALIRNVSINNVFSSDMAIAIILLQESGKLELRNVNISNCVSYGRMPVMDISSRYECDIIIDGCNIYNNFNYSPDIFNTLFQITPFDNYSTRLRIEIRNSAFYDNYQAMPAQMGNARPLNDSLFIDNCTFAGNTGGNATVAVQGTSVLTNNIFYNPAMTTQVWIPNNVSSGIHSKATLQYNNILGGIGGVYNSTSQNQLIWGEGNTADDPLFTYEGNRPYSLSHLSPLIDSGWQNASGLVVNGLDAGGNERLWDGDGDGVSIIDKGAYEYQPLFVPQSLSASLWQAQVILNWEMPEADRALSGYRIYRDHLPHADVSGAGNTYFREHIATPDTITYQVAALYGNVESALSDSVVVITSSVGVTDELAPSIPTLSIGPNPFSSLTVIRYHLPKSTQVELIVYNLRGQKVRTLEADIKTAGEHVLAWEGCDDNAQPVSSGIYFLRLITDGKECIRQKLVLLK